MKQNMSKMCALTGLMMSLGPVLPASAAERLHVTVPFSFVVGGAKMAAGEYAITEAENGLVTFAGAKTSAIVLSVPADYTKGNSSTVNFVTNESDKVLTGIQVSGASREIPMHSGRKTVLASAR